MNSSNTFKNLLFGLVKHIKLEMEKQFSELGVAITPFQFGILAIVRQNEPTQNEIAQKLGVRPPSLVRPVEHLVSMGLVERKSDPLDRRKVHLISTGRAEKIFAKIRKHNPGDRLNLAFGKLAKSKQKALVNLLSELNGLLTG